MALEDLVGTQVFIDALVRSNPTDEDPVEEGAAQIRGVKNVLLNSFPNVNGAVSATDEQLSAAALIGGLVTEQEALFGMIASWLMNPGASWAKCDGQTITRAAHPRFFEVRGIAGDVFVVPNLQGYFLRMLDPTGTVDPDGATRVIGSVQADMAGPHTHPDNFMTSTTGYFSGGTYQNYSIGPAGVTNTGNNSGVESRGKNVAVWFYMYVGVAQALQ
jgi:hypothetical protein